MLAPRLSVSERAWWSSRSVEITGWDGKVRTTPNFENRNHRVPNRLIEKILGVKLSDESISEAINRMGGKLIESRTITDGSERMKDGRTVLSEKGNTCSQCLVGVAI